MILPRTRTVRFTQTLGSRTRPACTCATVYTLCASPAPRQPSAGRRGQEAPVTAEPAGAQRLDELIASLAVDVPDFPSPGVVFMRGKRA